MNRRASAAREWTESIVVAVILALFIRAFIVQPFKIPTGSMIPTLKVGDRILVNKFIYGAKVPFTKTRLPKVRDPKVGDVIVFTYPLDKKKDYIKRLVGLKGQTIEIKNGNIYINGEFLDDPKIISQYYYDSPAYKYGQEGQVVEIPKDSYFVLGDNSASSSDSRVWGFVPERNVEGEAFLIFWPPNRIRLIK